MFEDNTPEQCENGINMVDGRRSTARGKAEIPTPFVKNGL